MAGGARKSAKELAALDLAVGYTVARTARRQGVAESTLYRWLKLDDFRARVSELRAAAVSRAISMLGASAAKAATTLVRLLDEEKVVPTVRLRAACSILELAFKGRELLELEERITALETLARQEGTHEP